MEKESTGERGMGVRYKGSQGQTKRTVELQEEEEEDKTYKYILNMLTFYTMTLKLNLYGQVYRIFSFHTTANTVCRHDKHQII
jgi:hypothetical protein